MREIHSLLTKYQGAEEIQERAKLRVELLTQLIRSNLVNSPIYQSIIEDELRDTSFSEADKFVKPTFARSNIATLTEAVKIREGLSELNEKELTETFRREFDSYGSRSGFYAMFIMWLTLSIANSDSQVKTSIKEEVLRFASMKIDSLRGIREWINDEEAVKECYADLENRVEYITEFICSDELRINTVYALLVLALHNLDLDNMLDFKYLLMKAIKIEEGETVLTPILVLLNNAFLTNPNE